MTSPTRPRQACWPLSTVTCDVDVVLVRPAPQLVAEEDVLGCPGAVEQEHPAVVRARAHRPRGWQGAAGRARCRPRRSTTSPPRPADDLPPGAEGTADAEHGARRGLHEEPGDRADVADRVLAAGSGRRRVAADRDRDLPDAERVQHRELAGSELGRLAVDRLEHQRVGVLGVLAALTDDEGTRQERVLRLAGAPGLGPRPVSAVISRPRTGRAAGSAPSAAGWTSP